MTAPTAEGRREAGRVEAFSDGVLAVIITIMAFELQALNGHSLHSLYMRLSHLLVYVLVLYLLGIGMARITPWIAYGLYVAVAVIWFVPDRRLTRAQAVPQT